MERASNSSKLIQDLSSLVATILPILQLFLTQLPPSMQGIFLASKQFTGVSIVTLVLSYIVIIAFQAKPWFELTLPFQSKKTRDYQDYLRKINEVSAASNFVDGEQASASKLDKFINELVVKPVSPPIKIKRDNIISLGLIMIFINALGFISLSFIGYSTASAIIQSINYILFIVFSVLVLSVYRHTVNNNLRYEYDNLNKTKNAIEVAVNNNVFGSLPNPRLVDSWQDNNIPSNLHLVVEHENKYYKVVTDDRGLRLLTAKQFKSYKEKI